MEDAQVQFVSTPIFVQIVSFLYCYCLSFLPSVLLVFGQYCGISKVPPLLLPCTICVCALEDSGVANH